MLGPDGTVLRDMSSRRKHAALTNFTPATAYEVQDGHYALRLVGGSSPSSHALTTIPFDIKPYTQPFTMAAWIKINSWRGDGAARGMQLMSIGNADFNSLTFQVWRDKVTVVADSTGSANWEIGDVPPVGATALSLATLYHVAIVRNTAGVYTAWLNGKEDGTATLESDLAINNTTLKLGCHYALNTTYDSDGWIYEIGIWPRVLASSEMKILASHIGSTVEQKQRGRSYKAAAAPPAGNRRRRLLIGN
jgi:hypothetical protein